MTLREAGIAWILAVLVPHPVRADDPGPGWAHDRPVPIAVEGGRARFSAPGRSRNERTLLVVSCLTRKPGPFPVRVTVRASDHPEAPRLAFDGPRRPPCLLPAFSQFSRIPETPHLSPFRAFSLPVREGDPASPSNYRTVRGRLRGTGQTVAVYVDVDDERRVEERVVQDVLATFDRAVIPLAEVEFGRARDVDGDGRFAVLLTGWLDRLADGRLSVDGFVRARISTKTYRFRSQTTPT